MAKKVVRKQAARKKVSAKKSAAKSKVAPRARLTKARRRFDAAKAKLSSDGRAEFLASGIAHEFNNLLGAADGHAEWALESGDPSDMRAALEVVRVACQRSAQITRALQGLYQPREEEKVSFQLSDLKNEILQLYGPLCAHAQVTLRVDLGEAKVFGSPSRLLEIFVNLLKNSLEAGPGKKSSRAVQIRSQKVGSRVKIEITDNGPGVPEVYREHLFEAFFTTKGVLKHVATRSIAAEPTGAQGSGLGLFLCRQIAQEHGGTLELLEPTAEWPGARFELTLPIDR